MNLLQQMSVLITQPWLALVPGALFLIAGTAVKSRLGQVVGFGWLLYCLFELGNKYRITCSGECNIRVDLVLIYPLLAIGSIAGLIAIVVKLLRRSDA